MIPVLQADKIAQIAQERALRVDRVGEYIANNILTQFNKNGSGAINLEIGCGHGHWLTSLAPLRYNDLFVGIDLLSKRIRKADRKKELLNLKNIFFLKAEATEFLEALPENIYINDTFIMHPDPWPKKKHHKNRLIQDSFLEALHDRSQQGSKLFFKTDHEPYFEWTKKFSPCLPHGSWVLRIGLMRRRVIFRNFLKVHIFVPPLAYKIFLWLTILCLILPSLFFYY